MEENAYNVCPWGPQRKDSEDAKRKVDLYTYNCFNKGQ